MVVLFYQVFEGIAVRVVAFQCSGRYC